MTILNIDTSLSHVNVDTSNFEHRKIIACEHVNGVHLELILKVRSKDDAIATNFIVYSGSERSIAYEGPSLETSVRRFNALYDQFTLV